MNERVRIQALRAAARVALGITALGGTAVVGCGGSLEPPTGAESGDDLAASGRHPVAKQAKDAGASDASSDGATAGEAGVAGCDELLAATEADPAYADLLTYRYEAPASMPPISDDLRSCCATELSGDAAWQTNHRWLCCNVEGNGVSTGPGTASACTPWGPPAPPAMYDLGAAEAA